MALALPPEGLSVDLIQPMCIWPPQSIKNLGHRFHAPLGGPERLAQDTAALEAGVCALAEHGGDGVRGVSQEETPGGSELRASDALSR